MHILKVGFNYRTTPVSIRETLVFSSSGVQEATKQLNEQENVLESVILSTCNRTEIYVVVDELQKGKEQVIEFLSTWFAKDEEDFLSYIQVIENGEAIKHLFRLATGLESMILGETQILGQVRNAFLTSQKEKTTGTIFNELFKRVITFAKKSHKETAIGEHAVSISYAAVQLIKEKLVQPMDESTAVVLGAGKMGSLATRNLLGANCKGVTIINRSVQRAKELAEVLPNVSYHLLGDLESTLVTADILITSTSSQQPVVTKALIENVMKKRLNRPLYVVDIAVPRDVDSDVHELDHVHLFDVDSLESIVDENLEARKKLAKQINANINLQLESFFEWLEQLSIVPVIRALVHKGNSIQHETMQSIERKIPSLTEREKTVIMKHTKSIVNQLLKAPIKELKTCISQNRSPELLQQFIETFDLEEVISEQILLDQQIKKKRAANLKQLERLSFILVENENE